MSQTPPPAQMYQKLAFYFVPTRDKCGRTSHRSCPSTASSFIIFGTLGLIVFVFFFLPLGVRVGILVSRGVSLCTDFNCLSDIQASNDVEQRPVLPLESIAPTVPKDTASRFRDFDVRLYECNEAFGFMDVAVPQRLTSHLTLPPYALVHVTGLVLLLGAFIRASR